MTTVQIAYDATSEIVAKIQAHLDHIAAHDVNWGGVEFEIERDDFTCIPDSDSAAAVNLLHDIQRIISGAA